MRGPRSIILEIYISREVAVSLISKKRIIQNSKIQIHLVFHSIENGIFIGELQIQILLMQWRDRLLNY